MYYTSGAESYALFSILKTFRKNDKGSNLFSRRKPDRARLLKWKKLFRKRLNWKTSIRRVLRYGLIRADRASNNVFDELSVRFVTRRRRDNTLNAPPFGVNFRVSLICETTLFSTLFFTPLSTNKTIQNIDKSAFSIMSSIYPSA